MSSQVDRVAHRLADGKVLVIGDKFKITLALADAIRRKSTTTVTVVVVDIRDHGDFKELIVESEQDLIVAPPA